MTFDQAEARLREWCPPGTTVHLIERSTSRTRRTVRVTPLVLPHEGGRARYIGGALAEFFGLMRHAEDTQGSVVVPAGAGDAMVGELSRRLYGSAVALRSEWL